MFDKALDTASNIVHECIEAPGSEITAVRDRLCRDLVNLLGKLRNDETDDRRIGVLKRIRALYEQENPALVRGADLPETLEVKNAIPCAHLETSANVSSVAMSRDGGLLAVVTKTPASPAEASLEIYSTEPTLLGAPPALLRSVNLGRPAQRAIFAPDGRSIAVVAGRDLIVLPLEERNGVLRAGPALVCQGEPGFDIRAVAISPDGSKMAFSAQCSEYLHKREGESLLVVAATADGRTLAELQYRSQIPALAFSANGDELFFSVRETETREVERGFFGRMLGQRNLQVEKSFSKIKALALDRPGHRPVDVIAEEDLPDFTCIGLDSPGGKLNVLAGSVVSTYELSRTRNGQAELHEHRDTIGEPGQVISHRLVHQVAGGESAISADHACVVSRSYDYKRIADDYWGREMSEFVGGRQIQLVLDLKGGTHCKATISDASLADIVETRPVAMSEDGKKLCLATPAAGDRSRTLVILYDV